MPQCCVIPECSTRDAGHRFPRDQPLLKKWLIAIKRDKFKPTQYSRICKKHFNESDCELPKDSVIENRNYILIFSCSNIAFTDVPRALA